MVYTFVIMTDDLTPDISEQPVDDADGQRRIFRYDDSEPQSVGLVIIQAVASVTDVDPLSLEPRLYDVIDPDALERLVSNGNPDNLVRVSFEFGQQLVTITNDSELIVQPLSTEQ